MDYFLFIWSVVLFIEKRIRTKIDYNELEAATGFSYRHIRKVFKERTKVTLSRYINLRKIENAAFEVIHTDKNLISIAEEFGFESYDTFTRVFKRETGVTPAEFRKRKYAVGRRHISAGAYAPAILKNGKNQLIASNISEVSNMENSIFKEKESCILFGVPKVQYSYEECTPFPSCLKACLNYMGQNIDYTFIMAASGASFRLRWNTKYWDGGNVDVQLIYENKFEAFERSFRAAGREYRILDRTSSDKNGFKKFIKDEIDCGRPMIALGIIGPPEACIITGYADNGETLLGWNFFQHNPEFAEGVKMHETGYFSTSSWWDNPNTTAVMSIGESQNILADDKDLIENAINVMTASKILVKDRYGNVTGEIAGGQEAYECWAKAIENDKEFPENSVLPFLFERMMCQSDAQVMVGEGRSYAACFIESIGKRHENVAVECGEAAERFRKAAQCAFKMNELKGGFEQNEASVRKFAESEVRKGTAKLICKAASYEAEACELMKSIFNRM